MREIKFRAWDKQTKCMSPEFVLFGEFVLLGAVHSWQFENGNKSESLEALGDLELMQYTGLKDKNGKEIYEGDFVKCMALPSGKKGERKLMTGKVIQGTFGWTISVYYKKEWWAYSAMDYTSLKVIGNIHENPELL